MARYAARWLPIPHICRPYPNRRLAFVTQGKSRMRQSRTSGSVEGVLSDGHSYSDWRLWRRSAGGLQWGQLVGLMIPG
jgi:hypothetical protein